MPSASGELVKITKEDRVAIVTIDHPPVNALNKQTLKELERVIADISAENELKAVILTGGGSLAFVAGADIKEMSRIASIEEAKKISELGQAVFLELQRLEKPVIAAINGVCLGGGLELAMSCHLRISGDRARFGQPEISLGIIPGWGGTQRLPRLIGKAKAMEWILTGDMVMAEEAMRLGIVNRVVPQAQVLKAAKDVAKKIASKGGVATKAALKALEQGIDLPLEEGLKKEAEAFGMVAGSEDSKEGIKAFLEKRQPQFKDR